MEKPSTAKNLWLVAAAAMLITGVLLLISGRALAGVVFAAIATVFVATAFQGDSRRKGAPRRSGEPRRTS